jgi:hypothetical protein
MIVDRTGVRVRLCADRVCDVSLSAPRGAGSAGG